MAANAIVRPDPLDMASRRLASPIAGTDHSNALAPTTGSPVLSRFYATRQRAEQNRSCSRRGANTAPHCSHTPLSMTSRWYPATRVQSITAASNPDGQPPASTVEKSVAMHGAELVEPLPAPDDAVGPTARHASTRRPVACHPDNRTSQVTAPPSRGRPRLPPRPPARSTTDRQQARPRRAARSPPGWCYFRGIRHRMAGGLRADRVLRAHVPAVADPRAHARLSGRGRLGAADAGRPGRLRPAGGADGGRRSGEEQLPHRRGTVVDPVEDRRAARLG